jgi:LysM repeat protein
MNIEDIINQIANELAPGNEEFRLSLHAIALAESGGNPSAIGDGGSSIGLFQNNMAGGRGAGHTKQDLLDPIYNTYLAARDLINHFNNAKAQGLSGSDVTRYMSRYGQRPAQGLWEAPVKYYGRTVGQGSATPQAPVATFDAYQRSIDDKSPSPTVSNTNINQEAPQNVTSTATATNPYIVKRGDTLWNIARQQLGSGSRWKELQGYSGDPRQMPIGSKIFAPPPPEQPPIINRTTNVSGVSTSTSPSPVPTPYHTSPPAPVPSPANSGLFGIGRMEGGIWYPFSKEEKKIQQKNTPKQTRVESQKQTENPAKMYNFMGDPIGFFKALPLARWLSSQKK